MKTYILKTKEMGSVIEQTYYKQHEITRIGHSPKEEIERCKRSRACSRIKEIVNCNNFDYFFTLTIKDDSRYDINYSISRLVKSFNYYKKLAKNKNYDFKFVYVFELTKNKGVHLHGFVSRSF